MVAARIQNMLSNVPTAVALKVKKTSSNVRRRKRSIYSALCHGALKSMIHTTFEEKQAATRDSSLFHATSKISPLPLKLLMCLPSFTFQMYS